MSPDTLRVDLMTAVRQGDIIKCQKTIEQGANVQGLQNYWSPLHDAAWFGHTDICALLLKYGANPHAYDLNGCTALYLASGIHGSLGFPETVEYLASMGADIDAQNNIGRSAIHNVVSHGGYETLKKVCDLRANANLTDHEGMTPLHLAAKLGFTMACSLLQSYGADASLKYKGMTAAGVAGRYKHKALAQQIQLHARANEALQVIKQTVQSTIQVRSKNNDNS